MKACSRPQFYRIRRMVQRVREGSETGCLPNSRDFMGEFGVSRRTVALVPPRRAFLSAVRQSVYGFPWAFGCSANWTRGHSLFDGPRMRHQFARICEGGPQVACTTGTSAASGA